MSGQGSRRGCSQIIENVNRAFKAFDDIRSQVLLLLPSVRTVKLIICRKAPALDNSAVLYVSYSRFLRIEPSQVPGFLMLQSSIMNSAKSPLVASSISSSKCF